MSAVLKDIDSNHTAREGWESSFALDLLLEGLIKEGKQLWLSVHSACIVAPFHTYGKLLLKLLSLLRLGVPYNFQYQKEILLSFLTFFIKANVDTEINSHIFRRADDCQGS